MTRTFEPRDDIQRREIARTLQSLAAFDTRDVLEGGSPPIISAFVSGRRETITQLVMPSAGLVVVIEGRKEIVAGVEHRIYQAGEVFVLPANAHVDVVNEPDAETGFYRALFIRFPRELVIEAARRWPQFVGQKASLEPVLSADLCSAIFHAAEALSQRVKASRRVSEHRILEILLILAEQGVLPLVPKYVDGSTSEAVRLLIRHRLHHAWSAANVAAHLAMSEATLRRRLRSEKQTLQMLLRTERMNAAYIVLNDRDADVADALAATGYRSRSHFARHFRDSFGVSPAAVRQRKQERVTA